MNLLKQGLAFAGTNSPRMPRMVFLGIVLLSMNCCSFAASLTDFGYRCAKINGKLPSGTRPMLLICASFTGMPPMPQPVSYYSNLVFNTAQTPSINGYFNAVSDGGFTFAPGGAIAVSMPANLTFPYVYSNYPSPPDPFATADGVYASNIIRQAMSSGQFNFQAYDANHDGDITVDELTIIIIVNDTNAPTGSRTSPPVPAPNGSYYWSGAPSTQPRGMPNVAFFKYFDYLVVMCEETEEVLGCLDIYGLDNLSSTLSPQSGGSWLAADSMYYLDPWNRMELGWCQPRIFSLPASGMAEINAAQAGDPTAPMILYDPSKGTNEFFMLEYRTHLNSVYGPGYDLTVGESNPSGYSDGLVIWHVQQDANHNLIGVVSPIDPGNSNCPSIWSENSPNLVPGFSAVLWGSGSATPNLKWYDGTQTPYRIKVLPFNPGDNTIFVQWLAPGDTWVDFNYTGMSENGSFSEPYTLFIQGVDNVTWGGTLHLKTGVSHETGTISKIMNLEAYNGVVTIGH